MTILQLFPDLICVAVLLLFLILGYSRGMFRTLSGLLTWLVSLFGAKLIADRGAPLMVNLLMPKVQPYVTQRLSEILSETAASSASGDGLGVLGLIPGVQDLLEGASGTLAETLAPAVAREVAQLIGWLILFVLGFIVLKLLCRLAVFLLDQLDKVPGLHLLNHLGGALLGVVKGLLVLILVMLILNWFDVLPRALVKGTVLLRWIAGIGGIY